MKIKLLLRGWKRGFDSSSSLSSSVPTGGHRPHDSISLPVGPSVIPLLLLLFLSPSSSSNTSLHACDEHAGGKISFLKKRYIQFWPVKTVTGDFGRRSFRFGDVLFCCWPRSRRLFRVKMFSPPPPPPLPSPSIFLQAVWFRGQHTPTSCHHSNTLHDFHLLIITFSC